MVEYMSAFGEMPKALFSLTNMLFAIFAIGAA
jgi:hypothetical protein